MVRVKICGITNLDDALMALEAGADALGFVFYPKSPRYIAPQTASAIINELPKKILKVGVFVNSQKKSIKDIAKLCSLDILQFHGQESPEFCGAFKGYEVIKAFRIKDNIGLKNILKYKTFGYLFDTFDKSKAGGTGKPFNWALLKNVVTNLRQPVFLSGGLTKDNVREAIMTLQPAWVDVSSAVELAPGKKDAGKIKEFIKVVKTYCKRLI